MKRNSIQHILVAIICVAIIIYFVSPKLFPTKIAKANDSKTTVSLLKNSAKPQYTSPTTTNTKQPNPVNWQKKTLSNSSLSRMKRPKHPSWMNIPKGHEKDVAFWINIYSKYKDHEVILHHPEQLDIIYTVIDLSDNYFRKDISDEDRREILRDVIDKERDIYSALLLELAQNPETASYTALKLMTLFPKNTKRKDFEKASENIRAQWGQKDKFGSGLQKSGEILGEMELIFKNANVPSVITRLALVESTFIHHAQSGAGAVGLWQFMPKTGKIFLRVDETMDERLDTLKSTTAAARLLRQYYETLNSWPLAINAYNAGITRLRHAVRKTGSRNISTIMRHYKHNSYGFASRNFFLEFIAAAEVADNFPNYLGDVQFSKPLEFVTVTFPKPFLISKATKHFGIPINDIKEINRSFLENIWDKNYPIPAFYTIRIPEKYAGDIIANSDTFYKNVPNQHLVKNGETWIDIASQFGMRSSTLKRLNPDSCKRRKCKLKTGMQLALKSP